MATGTIVLMALQTSVANRVAIARAKLGWTAEQLGEEAGLSRQHVNKIESGARARISAETLAKLANALGVSADWLLGRK